MEQLKKDFQFFLEHHDELVAKYCGKYIGIGGEKVIGVFNDEQTAIKELRIKFEPGTFIVQKVDPSPESYRQEFYSRVSFA